MENFNPRSPCGERLDQQQLQHNQHLFQSTLPVWGATGLSGHELDSRQISIHAPRVGSDHRLLFALTSTWVFQSTLPVWGATGPVIAGKLLDFISIHAPRVGSDGVQTADIWWCEISIHAPRVGSDPDQSVPLAAGGISIHAPRVGSDHINFG